MRGKSTVKAPPREKISVTIDAKLCHAVKAHASREGTSTSAVVDDALRLWHGLRIADLAREGYQAMRYEDRADAESYLGLLELMGDEA